MQLLLMVQSKILKKKKRQARRVLGPSVLSTLELLMQLFPG